MYKNEGGCPGRNESLSVDGSKQPEAGVARQALKGIVYLADTWRREPLKPVSWGVVGVLVGAVVSSLPQVTMGAKVGGVNVQLTLLQPCESLLLVCVPWDASRVHARLLHQGLRGAAWPCRPHKRKPWASLQKPDLDFKLKLKLPLRTIKKETSKLKPLLKLIKDLER